MSDEHNESQRARNTLAKIKFIPRSMDASDKRYRNPNIYRLLQTVYTHYTHFGNANFNGRDF